MEILSLDILKLGGFIGRAWRWLRRQPDRDKDEVLRYNVEGLEIVVTNRKGRIVNSSFHAKSIQQPSNVHGTVESSLLSIEIDRAV